MPIRREAAPFRHNRLRGLAAINVTHFNGA